MKKFKFRLESVLKYKGFLEKEAKQALMAVNSDIKECEANIGQIKLKRLNLIDELENETIKGITIEAFQMYQNYISSVDYQLAREEKRLEYLFNQRELKTMRLIEARKETEVMERLKKNKKKKYIEEMLYEEQKELDEISSIKKAREICNEL